MKLITNYKDYYDFLIRKYGIDEKAVYERVTKIDYWLGHFWLEWEPKMQPWHVYALAFCWEIISVAKYDWKVRFWNDIDLSKLSNELQREDYSYSDHVKENIVMKSIHWEMTDINETLKCPLIVLTYAYWFVNWRTEKWESKRTWNSFATAIRNPKAENFWLDKYVSPDEAFIKITNFLLEEKVVPNNQTDIEKVESHGFDKKRSFRPKMK